MGAVVPYAWKRRIFPESPESWGALSPWTWEYVLYVLVTLSSHCCTGVWEQWSGHRELVHLGPHPQFYFLGSASLHCPSPSVLCHYIVVFCLLIFRTSPGSELRDHSWTVLGNHMGSQGSNPGAVMYYCPRCWSTSLAFYHINF